MQRVALKRAGVRFPKKGEKGTDGRVNNGRPKGVPNKTTTLLKTAILMAASRVGRDLKGKDGLEGYLMRLAIGEPKAMAMLLAKVLPLQITGGDGKPLGKIETGMTVPELMALYHESLAKMRDATNTRGNVTRH